MMNKPEVVVWRVSMKKISKLKLVTMTECYVLAADVKEAIAIVGEKEGSIMSVCKVCRVADLPGNRYIISKVK